MRPSVRVIHYTPADRAASNGTRKRLHHVMTHIQEFFRREMDKNQFGPITFPLEVDENEQTVVHFIQGAIPTSAWRRDYYDQLKHEIRNSRRRGEHEVDLDHETVVVFTDLLQWQDGKSKEIGPYAGGGGIKYGLAPDCWTAWVIDDTRLNFNLLSSSEDGAWYNDAACTWGEFNSHYIGGIAHELGHAFGLPHDSEHSHETSIRGTSLMGRGNHVYGRELRSAERGAFLTRASAAPLSVHPFFTGSPRYLGPLDWQLVDATVESSPGLVTFKGTVVGTSPAVGVIAYNADALISEDYHATAEVAQVDSDGRFSVDVPAVAPGTYWLQLRAYGHAGMFKIGHLSYSVEHQKAPSQLRLTVESEPS